jgi:hypothetical protein
MEILRSNNLERAIRNDVLRVTKLETRRLASRLAFWLTDSDSRFSVERVPEVIDLDRQRRLEQGFMVSLIVLMS